MIEVTDPRMPMVSIITPCYNSSRYINVTIESVQSQTYKNWEMIIVDDCSNDDSCEIVEQKARGDKRIHLMKHTKNSGPAISRNTALAAAKGRYIAFLDSDDLWLPKKLENQVSFMQQHNIAFSYTLYRHMSESGDRCGSVLSIPDLFDYSDLLKHTGIGCLTVMLDRDKIGPVQMSNIHDEDYALWLSIMKQGFRAYCLQEDLARYRVTKSSVSGRKIKAASWVWQIYRNVEKLSLPYACWCFINYSWRAFLKSKSL